MLWRKRRTFAGKCDYLCFHKLQTVHNHSVTDDKKTKTKSSWVIDLANQLACYCNRFLGGLDHLCICRTNPRAWAHQDISLIEIWGKHTETYFLRYGSIWELCVDGHWLMLLALCMLSGEHCSLNWVSLLSRAWGGCTALTLRQGE